MPKSCWVLLKSAASYQLPASSQKRLTTRNSASITTGAATSPPFPAGSWKRGSGKLLDYFLRPLVAADDLDRRQRRRRRRRHRHGLRGLRRARVVLAWCCRSHHAGGADERRLLDPWRLGIAVVERVAQRQL